MSTEKKVVFLRGSVQFPLRIGTRAIVHHSGDPIWTSIVSVIQQISEDLIVFETQNSTYCVSPYQTPALAAPHRTAMCA